MATPESRQQSYRRPSLNDSQVTFVVGLHIWFQGSKRLYGLDWSVPDSLSTTICYLLLAVVTTFRFIAGVRRAYQRRIETLLDADFHPTPTRFNRRKATSGNQHPCHIASFVDGIHHPITPHKTSKYQGYVAARSYVPSSRPRSVIGITSYQYPPLPPRDGAEIDVSQANYMDSRLMPAIPNMEGTQMSPAQRRESLLKDFKLKRSISTPNVRTQGTNEAEQGLPNEKKRNRLGYHRTPIACECQYTPVNQQQQQQPPPPPPTGQRQGARTFVGTNQPSPSTPPAMPNSRAVEAQSTTPFHQLITMPSMPSTGQQPIESGEDETYSPEPKVQDNISSNRSFSYGHGAGDWISSEGGSGVARTPSSANSPWANYTHGLPETQDLSSYPSHPPPASLSTWTASSTGEPGRLDTSSRLDDAWRSYPSETRSMSYSSDDQAVSFTSPSTRSYDRAHLSVATGSILQTSLSGEGPFSASAAPHSTYSTWSQSYQYPRPNNDYGGWYEDHEGHQSEVHDPSTAESPSQTGGSIYYSGR
ncbi:hypothetical protein GGR54DRAFT_638290 [Hypoxylon sp. NC1633]|nr:hypothetical protein GGR54DRAFT_638290 [Hypoxylon sp. NC1633]